MTTLPMTLRSRHLAWDSEVPLWTGLQDEEVEELLRKRSCLQRTILIDRAFQRTQWRDKERCLPSVNSSGQMTGSYCFGFRICSRNTFHLAAMILSASVLFPVGRLIWNSVLILTAKESTTPCMWDNLPHPHTHPTPTPTPPPPLPHPITCILFFCGKLGLDLVLWGVSTIKSSLWGYNEKGLSS